MTVLLALLLIAATAGTRASDDAGTAPGLRVALDGDALSLSSRDMPLRDVLEAIAERGGFELLVPASLERRAVTLSFHDVPLQAALRRLLDGVSYTVTYRASTQPGATRLRELRILATGGPGTRVAAAPTPAAATASATNDATRQAAQAAALRASIESTRRRALTDEDYEPPSESPKDTRAAKVQELIDAVRTGADAAARVQALESLMRIGRNDARVKAIALESLDDADPVVRRGALSSLASIPGVIPGETLLTMALSDSDPQVRSLAVHLAAKALPPEEAVVMLERAAKDDNDWVQVTAKDLLRSMTR